MKNPPIRHVVFAVLVLAVVVQVGFAPNLSDLTETPDGDRPVLTKDPLAGDPVERGVVRAIRDLNVPGMLVLAGAIRNGDDPLDNEIRAAIYDAVEEDSVIRLTRLARDLDTPTSTVRYHVRVLDNAGFVDVETIWGKRWLSSPTVERTDVVLAAALADEALTSVFETLREREPATVSELATALDRAPSTVSYHLQRLANADLVERERDGASVHTALTDDVRERLDDEL